MYWRAALSMSPHEAVGGCVPSPRKDSAASVRMAVENDTVVWTRMGAAMFGRTCRPMIRPFEAPDRARSLDVRHLDDGQRRPPRDARERRRVDDADGHHRVGQARAEHARDGDREDEGGQRQHDVHDPHRHVVDPAPEVAGDDARRRAEPEGDQDGQPAHVERDPRAPDQPAQLVPPELVGPEKVRGPGGQERLGDLRRRAGTARGPAPAAPPAPRRRPGSRR